MRSRHTATMVAVLAVALTLGMAAHAASGHDEPCPDGGERIGYLGIAETSGSLTAYMSPGGGLARVQFLSEPEIVEVVPGGPAEGKLRPGDVLVSLDGHLITTEAAGLVYAHPPTYRDLDLVVRRNGRMMTVTMRPEAVCPDEVQSPFATWSVSPASIDLVTMVPMPPEAFADSWHPTMWLGFGLRCSMEGTLARAHEDGTPRWRFLTKPKVISIQPDSPAADSELRVGDLITEIDGIPIDTEEAASRIADIDQGDRVVLTIRRMFRTIEVPIIAGERSPFAPVLQQRLGVDLRVDEPGDLPIQFVGTLGEVGLEVRSPEHMRVTVDEDENEITLLVGEAELRVWRVESE